MHWKLTTILFIVVAITTIARGEERQMTLEPTTASVDGGTAENQWILSLNKLRRSVPIASDSTKQEAIAVAEDIALSQARDLGNAKNAGLAASYGVLEASRLDAASAYLRTGAEFARFAKAESDPFFKQQYLLASRYADELADAMLAQHRWLKELRNRNAPEANPVFLDRLERFVMHQPTTHEAYRDSTAVRELTLPADTPAAMSTDPVESIEKPPLENPFKKTVGETDTSPPQARAYSSWIDIQDAIESLKAK